MKLEKAKNKKAEDQLLKQQIEQAKEKAKKSVDISGKVVLSNDGTYKLDQSANLDPSLNRIVNHLISTDVRKHNRYCPCCKNYEEGADLSLNQMGEFLEYIRQLHTKLVGDPRKNMKKGRPKEYVLDYDSVSDITDLSEKGILTTSMDQLSPNERKRLEQYMRKMRQLQQAHPPKHDCLTQKKGLDNKRMMVEMQLRGVQQQLEKADDQNSAHQFSQRSIQLQVDDNERAEIDVQTALIDLKSRQPDINVYDLSQAQPKSFASKIGFKQTADAQCGTGEPSKIRMMAPQDWYFSELNRRLMREFYKKNNLVFTQEILASFKSFDDRHSHLKLTPLDKPETIPIKSSQQILKRASVSKTTVSGSNPQESTISLGEAQMLCEPEITYLTSILKQDTEKWQQFEVLKELHAKSSLTAKTLTKELIEGKTPIGLIINHHKTIHRDSVVTLLYRCEKLFQARSDVQKILLLLLKLNNAPNATTRTPHEHQQLVQRLKGLVGQFKTEYRMYDQTFIYKGRDVIDLAESEKDDQFEAATSRSQLEKADDRQIQDILKTEARYEGAISKPIDQESEIQIVDRMTDEIQSNSYASTVSKPIRSSFIDKVKGEIYQVRNSYNQDASMNPHTEEYKFTVEVASYVKNGEKYKKASLFDTVAYQETKVKKSRHRRQINALPH